MSFFPRAIVKELVETEEDFAKDMQFVVENYYKQMDNPRLPKEFRDRKGSIFGNFKDISDFHNKSVGQVFIIPLLSHS